MQKSRDFCNTTNQKCLRASKEAISTESKYIGSEATPRPSFRNLENMQAKPQLARHPDHPDYRTGSPICLYFHFQEFRSPLKILNSTKIFE